MAIIAKGVIQSSYPLNVRSGPGYGYNVIGQLEDGTVVDIIELPEAFDSKHWVMILYNGDIGCVMASYVKVD